MADQIEILRRSPSERRTLITAAAAAVRGQFFQESATAGTAELADGTRPLAGAITRDAVVGGPVLADHVMPGRLELPFTTGQEGSFEQVESYEAEGASFLVLTPTTGFLAAGTALQTELSFIGGKLRVAQTGDLVEYKLVEQQTPQDSGNTVRIRVEKVNTKLKP